MEGGRTTIIRTLRFLSDFLFFWGGWGIIPQRTPSPQPSRRIDRLYAERRVVIF